MIGDERCPIVDTWWQTETGGILITPLPGATKLKPGSATRPFFGVVPEIVDADGKVLEGETQGNLCIAKSWPGQMRTVYGDHARFEQTYFSTYKGKYFTGDGCRRDADGYYWITGRVDDVINVSGHRMGTAEVESSLVANPAVSEAAVVGYPHDIKGQGIYAYVTLMTGTEPTDALRKELVAWVRKDIGPIASPDLIQFAPGLPKTRSGKIMRRILRKIAEDEPGSLGDTSTLADPAVVDDLVKNRQNKKGAGGVRALAAKAANDIGPFARLVASCAGLVPSGILDVASAAADAYLKLRCDAKPGRKRRPDAGKENHFLILSSDRMRRTEDLAVFCERQRSKSSSSHLAMRMRRAAGLRRRKWRDRSATQPADAGLGASPWLPPVYLGHCPAKSIVVPAESKPAIRRMHVYPSTTSGGFHENSFDFSRHGGAHYRARPGIWIDRRIGARHRANPAADFSGFLADKGLWCQNAPGQCKVCRRQGKCDVIPRACTRIFGRSAAATAKPTPMIASAGRRGPNSITSARCQKKLLKSRRDAQAGAAPGAGRSREITIP